MELYLFIVVVLFGLAISDLIVGVSNDAVNFLNSAVGSQVAPRWIIMIIASIGILLGVTFSSGMMEVARKGIFHPDQFVMPELLIIFLAVMITDVILLDFFNTFALPTSTTVSVVFELLGASVAVSLIKIHHAAGGLSDLVNYINTAKALAIISGILLSIVVAFTVGAIVQFISRMIFTFEFKKRLKRYGAVWGSFALTAITYFILIKGSKGASFLTAETMAWISSNTLTILLLSIILWMAVLQVTLLLTRIHILKLIVLIGTGALAMAFAANDLVNFIGVPMAGFHAFRIAAANGSDPLQMTMEAMAGNVQSKTWMLLIAGTIMVVTLWLSRKARSVTKTEVSLGRQDEEGEERFGSSGLARLIVRMMFSLADGMNRALPESSRSFFTQRFNRTADTMVRGERPPFDLLRASVNLMVASALISFATSLKLPLSTTYVTFMVSMGTSLADRAWGRESAVYRITGVLTVVGGWFFTAFVAFTVSMICANLIFYFRLPAILVLIALAASFVVKTHYIHKRREDEAESTAKSLAFSDSASELIAQLSRNLAELLDQSAKAMKMTYHGTFAQNRKELKNARKQAGSLNKSSQKLITRFISLLKYSQDETEINPRLIGALQELGRHMTELTEVCRAHVENHHRGLLDWQQQELGEVAADFDTIVQTVKSGFLKNRAADFDRAIESGEHLREKINTLNKQQIKRIRKENMKTKQSLLYFRMLAYTDEIVNYVLVMTRGCRENIMPE